MKAFFEAMFFHPRWYHYGVIIVLSPLSLLYGLVMWVRRVSTIQKDFGLPIISVGNLIVGGAGKTPFVIAIASQLEDVTIISRGYGRLSQGLVEVSHRGKILTNVEQSGDEAMLMAQSLLCASVIVSEDRENAIALAKERGAKVIVLDDGFNRVTIKKFDILLEPSTVHNYLPFPAGGFREFWFSKKYADMVLKEQRDFERVVEIDNLCEPMVLLTAISNPQRLDRFLPSNVVAKWYLDDHAYFDETQIKAYLAKHQASVLLCTSKDRVKLQAMDVKLCEMQLTLQLDNDIMANIDLYMQG